MTEHYTIYNRGNEWVFARADGSRALAVGRSRVQVLAKAKRQIRNRVKRTGHAASLVSITWNGMFSKKETLVFEPGSRKVKRLEAQVPGNSGYGFRIASPNPSATNAVGGYARAVVSVEGQEGDFEYPDIPNGFPTHPHVAGVAVRCREYGNDRDASGWGNGYVDLLPGHPWYDMDAERIPAIAHAGIDYSRIVDRNGMAVYRIGFDTVHVSDDPRLTRKYVVQTALCLYIQACDCTAMRALEIARDTADQAAAAYREIEATLLEKHRRAMALLRQNFQPPIPQKP